MKSVLKKKQAAAYLYHRYKFVAKETATGDKYIAVESVRSGTGELSIKFTGPQTREKAEEIASHLNHLRLLLGFPFKF